ncbi:MAG: type IV secretion system DNA-binding domain-containing protein, partial [Erysipelotrichaceae bacterium]|nr:type IV secretion system DNA-binding domain-containing protein [Erysipelotrichaceae bacterium]
MDVKQTPLHGTILQQNPIAASPSPFLSIPGFFNGKPFPLNIGKEILSRHAMLIGATGCGKTNVFCHMVSQIKKQMTENDVM